MTAPVVVFDVGSTLIHPDFAVLRNWVARTTGVESDIPTIEYAFRRAIAGDIFSDENDEGAQAHRFFTHCGCQEKDMRAWRTSWNEIVQSGGSGSWLYRSLDRDARTTLQLLRSAGYRLIAASNSNGTLRRELAQFGLLESFEETFDSADLGIEKPALEFYQHVLCSFPRARRFVHVGDDLVKDVVGPIAAGFQQAVLYDPAWIYCGLPRGATINRLMELRRVLGDTP